MRILEEVRHWGLPDFRGRLGISISGLANAGLLQHSVADTECDNSRRQ